VVESVSPEASLKIDDRGNVSNSFDKVKACHAEFGSFFAEVFDELDTLQAEFVREREQWQAEQRRAESKLALQIAQLDQERAELAAGGAEAAHVSEVMADLAQTRRELAEARAEISRQREKLKAAQAEAAQVKEDPQVERQLQKAQKQCDALNQERALLEAELESVRNRAAELAETVEQQKREMAEQQTHWDKELKQQRRLLEKMAGDMRRQEPPPSSTTPQAPPPEENALPQAPPAADNEDMVLDSVMAQFEMLQKDVARRRARGF
jgi:chromosome segregation ATPase